MTFCINYLLLQVLMNSFYVSSYLFQNKIYTNVDTHKKEKTRTFLPIFISCNFYQGECGISILPFPKKIENSKYDKLNCIIHTLAKNTEIHKAIS